MLAKQRIQNHPEKGYTQFEQVLSGRRGHYRSQKACPDLLHLYMRSAHEN